MLIRSVKKTLFICVLALFLFVIITTPVEAGSVLSGVYNSASGYCAVVSGGYNNSASGHKAAVSGGYQNTASGYCAIVSGGEYNLASGHKAAVSGGYQNTASGYYASASGGYHNTTAGNYSTVSGGYYNSTSGFISTVSGGYNNTAGGNYSTVSGGYYNTAGGYNATVSGGSYNSAGGDYSWVSGRNMYLTGEADRTFLWGYSAYPINVSTSDAFIIYSGDVAIGTTDPDGYKLNVNGDVRCISIWESSDERLKKCIEPLKDSLNKVNQLQGVNYEWRIDEYPEQDFPEGKQVGLIAQDVENIIPEVVNTSDDGYKSISYEKLTAVLIEAVKELKEQNEELEARIEYLENRP
jgi:hypothetical protein